MTIMRRMEEIGTALMIRDGAARDLGEAPRWKLTSDWASVRRRDVREWDARLVLLGYCDAGGMSDAGACGARG